MLSDLTLSDIMTIYIFDDDAGDNYSEMKVKINEEKILNEINKRLLLIIKNEVVSV
jgi:hypothetical protein